MHLPLITYTLPWASHTSASGPSEGSGWWYGRHFSITLNPSLWRLLAVSATLANVRAPSVGLVHLSANPTSNADKSAKTNDEIQYLNLNKLDQLRDEKKENRSSKIKSTEYIPVAMSSRTSGYLTSPSLLFFSHFFSVLIILFQFRRNSFPSI